MKLAVFLDASHQQKYVRVIRETLAGIPETVVEAVGPGTEGSGTAAFLPRNRLQTWFGPHAAQRIQRLYERFRISLSRSIFYVFISDARWRSYVEKQVFGHRPDHIILLEDNPQGLPGIVAQMARDRGVPFSILPDYIPNPAEPARFFYSDPSHSADSWVGHLILRFLPRWSLKYQGKILLRLPAKQILVKQLRKQECPQPWILNAGYCEAIFLESKAMMEHYQRLGFIEEKLRVVGGAMEDKLHDVFSDRETLRHELCDRYGFDSQKPLIVCGFPPDQYNASTAAFEYLSYNDLCEAWFDELCRATPSANIVVVRHPRLSTRVLTPYLKQSIILAEQPIEELLPLCDLYIACVSTTIRSALALAIPTINYDCYRYEYGDFSRAAGIREVDSRERFRATLSESLVQDKLVALKASAASDARYWGVVDGGFRARLREAILEVGRAYQGRPTATHETSFRLEKWG